MGPTWNKLLLLATAASAFGYGPSRAPAQAVRVELRQQDGNWQLLRGGQPYFINGGGGDGSKELLKASGGNSFRTWGVEEAQARLDEAQRLGLTVTLGFWVAHQKDLDYTNVDQVAAQADKVREAVLKFKDHPALLVWALGNEMEDTAGTGKDAAVLGAINNLAAMVHKLDPNHPTMTVVAELGGQKVANINKLCPEIDILGINSYAGGPSVAKRYPELGGTKPYIITEFGPPGQWEWAKSDTGAPLEPTSTEKAKWYRDTWTKSVAEQKGKLCLGGYAFLWGQKQEVTATWYGVFLPDATRLEALDTMTELWGGAKPANHCPVVKPLKVDGGKDITEPNQTIHVALDASDPDGDALSASWELHPDAAQYNTGGAHQDSTKAIEGAIVHGDIHGADVKMPADNGGYWLYAYVRDGKGSGATAVLPLRVGPASAPIGKANGSGKGAGAKAAATDTASPAQSKDAAKGQPAKLPLTIYDEGSADKLPYAPSGFMGETQDISMEPKCADKPHSGSTCLKCEFKNTTKWGGVVWQDPAEDWGEKPGGYDLTGAKHLTFWARGAKGGESVSFKMGILGSEKAFPDSGSAALENVALTTDWNAYSIDLEGKDLSRIKTGFVWVVAAQGEPVTFYLDDIRYE